MADQDIVDKLDEIFYYMQSVGGSISKTSSSSKSGPLAPSAKTKSKAIVAENTARKKSVESIKLLNSGFNDTSKAAKGLGDSLGYGTKKIAANILGLSGNFATLGGVLTTFSGGVIVGSLANIIDGWTGAFKKTMGVGQTFGGEMMEMSKIAASSGQSLEQFATSVSEYGNVVAITGVQEFATLTKEVRLTSKDMGMFGLTMEEMNKHVGEQQTTMRALGMLDIKSKEESAEAMINLENNTLNLSGATGKAKDEIFKMAQELQRTPILFGYLNTLPDNLKSSVQGSVQQAMSVFASLPDNVAKILGTGLSEGLALGSTMLSGQMKDVAMLMPGVGIAMDNVRKKAQAGGDAFGASVDVIEKMQNLPASQVKMLNVLAAAGDSAAQQMLEMKQSVEGLRLEQLRTAADDKRRMGTAAKTFMSFQQSLASIGARFKTLFFTIMEPALEWLMEENGPLDAFNEMLTDFADDGALEEISKQIKGWVQEMVDGLPIFSDLIKSIKGFFFSISEGKTPFQEMIDKVGGVAKIFGLVWLGIKAFGIILALISFPFVAMGLAVAGLIGVLLLGPKQIKDIFDIDIEKFIRDLFTFDFWPFNVNKNKVPRGGIENKENRQKYNKNEAKRLSENIKRQEQGKEKITYEEWGRTHPYPEDNIKSTLDNKSTPVPVDQKTIIKDPDVKTKNVADQIKNTTINSNISTEELKRQNITLGKLLKSFNELIGITATSQQGIIDATERSIKVAEQTRQEVANS